MSANKIYVIGLPRTGTTSLCVAMLDLGFTVAHTAYTPLSMDSAQVIADTPIFNDYQQLDKLSPNAKFIYLKRDLSLWIPSIQQLLQRMHKNVTRTDGGFNPILKRCFQNTFAPLTIENINDEAFLANCYQKHFQNAQQYFSKRSQDLLIIDVSQKESYGELLAFLALDKPVKTFEKVNIGGKITAWNKVKHPLKIEANAK